MIELMKFFKKFDTIKYIQDEYGYQIYVYNSYNYVYRIYLEGFGLPLRYDLKQYYI